MKKQIKEGAVWTTSSSQTEGILEYIPDTRNLSSLSTLMFGLFILCVLPGLFKGLATFFIIVGLALFYRSYISRSKVDLPDGYDGIICNWGMPIDKKPLKGRNWFISLNSYLPFQISTRDQVTTTICSSVTSDFGSMQMENQMVWRIKDNKKFIETTTPDGVIKLISLYSRYIGIRIITSMNSRVKFVGTQNMVNIREALNIYLEKYGVEVIRANIPRINNPIIEDLEQIRTELVSIEQFTAKSLARKESAIKDVESTIRKAQRDSRTTVNNLTQAKVGLETIIAGKINTLMQQFMISARKELERAKTQLMKDIETFKAKKDKNSQILASISGVEIEMNLKMARLKRKVFSKMMPRYINVIAVPGLGQAAILQKAAEMFGTGKDLFPDDTQTTRPKPKESIVFEKEESSE